MKTLLQHKTPPARSDSAHGSPPKPQRPGDNRLFVLIPEGAFTYRLAALPDLETASAYVDARLIPGQSFLAFWAHHPGTGAKGTRGDALVLIREEDRRDIVQPYSFTDVEAARLFLEREVDPGVSPDRILLLWAEPAEVPRGLTPAPGAVEAVAAPKAPAGGDGESEAVVAAPGIFSRLASWPGWDGLGPALVSAAAGRRQAYYDALDSDEYSDARARIVVVAGGFSAAAGAAGLGLTAPAWHFIFAVLGWGLAAAVIYGAAVLLMPGRRPDGARRRLLVSLAFAYSPAAMMFLGAFPVFGPLFLLAVLIWMGWTFTVAVPVALELEADQGAVIALCGWVFLFAFTLIAPSMLV